MTFLQMLVDLYMAPRFLFSWICSSWVKFYAYKGDRDIICPGPGMATAVVLMIALGWDFRQYMTNMQQTFFSSCMYENPW